MGSRSHPDFFCWKIIPTVLIPAWQSLDGRALPTRRTSPASRRPPRMGTRHPSPLLPTRKPLKGTTPMMMMMMMMMMMIFWCSIPCVFCLYILLKGVSYCDLSVLSTSVMGFQKKKFGWGVGGWGELYPSLFWIFGIFFNCKAP